MSTKAEERIHIVCRKLEKRFGRVLQIGETVQEGDLLCALPDEQWVAAAAIGLTVSIYDFGWYRRPLAKGALN
jgi:hypothetical protein